MKNKKILIGSVALGCILITQGILFWSARTVFDFHDMSAFFDTAYRWSIGQELYKDVIYNSGPSHIVLYGLFIKFFGANQWAILWFMLAMQGLFGAVVFCYACQSASGSHKIFKAVLVTAFSSLGMWGPIRHPWYDQTAWIFGLSGIMILAMTNASWKGNKLSRGGLETIAGLFIVFSVLAKINVGLPLAMVALVQMLRTESSSRSRTFFSVLSGGLFGIILIHLANVNLIAFFDQTVLEYSPERRLLVYTKLVDVIMSKAFVISLTMVAWLTWARTKMFGLCLQIFLIWIIASWTGTIMLNTYYPHLAFLLVPVGAIRFKEISKLKAATSILPLMALVWIVSVNSIYPSFWAWRSANIQSDFTFDMKSFEGWRCARVNCEPFQKLLTYLQQKKIRDNDLFIYPDSTILYSQLGISSYRPAPFEFVTGDFPPPGKLTHIFVEGFRNHPPKWLVVSRFEQNSALNEPNAGFNSLEIFYFIKSAYEEMTNFDFYHVLKLKD